MRKPKKNNLNQRRTEEKTERTESEPREIAFELEKNSREILKKTRIKKEISLKKFD